MALSLFAAHALVGSYLQGRQLPDTTLAAILEAVEVRLKDGKVPVLDDALRELIDSEASTPDATDPVRMRSH